jgi:hypothetical protein
MVDEAARSRSTTRTTPAESVDTTAVVIGEVIVPIVNDTDLSVLPAFTFPIPATGASTMGAAPLRAQPPRVPQVSNIMTASVAPRAKPKMPRMSHN